MARILVADDSETILLLLRTRLELAGYEVETAVDGQEVTERMHGSHPGGLPDLLLLDAMMPRKSGIDALRELRAAGVDTPALIVSAHQDATDANAPNDLEVSGYLAQADRLRPPARQHRRADVGLRSFKQTSYRPRDARVRRFDPAAPRGAAAKAPQRAAAGISASHGHLCDEDNKGGANRNEAGQEEEPGPAQGPRRSIARHRGGVNRLQEAPDGAEMNSP